jgi:type III restriction enzyme
MTDALIENPILNSPYEEPTRHWKFTEEGITNAIEEGRRVSAYFMPIAKSKKEAAQQPFETEWTSDRIEENKEINRIRERVDLWRRSGWKGVTPTTRKLLEYWTKEDREKPLFFCQIEAVETAIYIGEIVTKQSHQDAWIVNALRERSEDANPGLFRLALKMATGTGKTVVMAMLIAWQALNKLANKQDSRFSDAFLIVTPGITIRDRLRVLLPQSPDNYYRERDVLPNEDIVKLGQARIVITNFHGFLLRDRTKASKVTKEILAQGGPNPFQETPDQMVRRVCREFGSKKGIIVINDEAHHCYRHRIGGEASDFEPEKLKGDEKKEATEREEQARVWISGLEAVNSKLGIKTVYDLSATPFFLSGSGYPEGNLFPWVVSDFALIDAIEAGLVKVPRVPVADDAASSKGPVYRNLWPLIRDDLPKKSVKDQVLSSARTLPKELDGALHSLYSNYEKAFKRWEKQGEENGSMSTPPVFIVVCNNTSVSKLVYDYLAGWEKQLDEEKAVLVPGDLPLFSNVKDKKWLARPNTILVDSAQLESGEGLSTDFKKVAATEIEQFKDEYRHRFPGRDAEELTDEDLLREVMNTVGKRGRLGEHVRCVVSVSMLTEGWSATTVTHILGVRAFGTQLLCEQVVGRGLRRRSYAANEEGMFEPEYAEVYGVPFSFIPCSGIDGDPPPPPPMTRVRALEDRAALEITYPRVRGYRYEIPGDQLAAAFTDDSRLALSTKDVPSMVEMLPVIGEGEEHQLDDLRSHREQEVAFRLAKRLFELYWPDEPWTFPQLVKITRDWMGDYLALKDNTFVQMLLIQELGDRAAEKIRHAIVAADHGEKTLVAILALYDRTGSTSSVDFDTVKPVIPTDPKRCHVSHVVCDTDSWEQKLAQVLEGMDDVVSYVKNEGLGFSIPYTHKGEQREYFPDFIARIDDGNGPDDLLNLVIEVSAPDNPQTKEKKDQKVATAKGQWIPAVNNLREFGRWAFLEITDPWNAHNSIDEFIESHEAVPA